MWIYNNIKCATGVILMVWAFAACSHKYEMHTITGFAQGSYYNVKYFDSLGRDFTSDIDSLLTAFDYTASVYNEGSVISRLNAGDTMVVLNDDFIQLFNISQYVSRVTDGKFDITVSPLIKAWGFGPQKSKVEPDSLLIDSLLQLTGWQKVSVHNGRLNKENDNMQLDMNAIAQGYSVDKVSEYLMKQGVDNFIVDIGGEVRAHGQKPGGEWLVGIEEPTDSNTQLMASLPLRNASLVTSGNYRKYQEHGGEKYSHIINPLTGYPLQQSLLSVVVLHAKAVYADAYATAFMVMGLDAAMQYVQDHNDIEVYMIYSENGEYKVYASPGMQQLLNEP